MHRPFALLLLASSLAFAEEHRVALTERMSPRLVWNDRGVWKSALGEVTVRALPLKAGPAGQGSVKLSLKSPTGATVHRFHDAYWGEPFFSLWCARSETELVGFLFEDPPSLGWEHFQGFVRVRVVNGALVVDAAEGAAPPWYDDAERTCFAL